MRTSDLLTSIATAIKDNPALNAWCLEHFHRAPEVRIGLDPDQQPEKESYPVVTVFRLSHARVNNSKRATWTVLLGVGVCAPGDETVLDNGVIVINGELLAEDLRELAEEAVFAARLGKVEPSSDVPDGAPLSFHLCWSTLQIETIG